MINLAGYLVGSLTFSNEGASRLCDEIGTDHGRVATMLRIVASHNPEGAEAAVRRMRVACFRLLNRPRQTELLHQVAGRLLEKETILQHEFYDTWYSGRCGAVPPDDDHDDRRCFLQPHGFGGHTCYHLDTNPATVSEFRGLPMPDRRQKVTQMPGNQKRLRAFNLGGPGPPLTKVWQPVLAACSELDVPASELAASPLVASLRALAYDRRFRNLGLQHRIQPDVSNADHAPLAVLTLTLPASTLTTAVALNSDWRDALAGAAGSEVFWLLGDPSANQAVTATVDGQPLPLQEVARRLAGPPGPTPHNDESTSRRRTP